MHGAGDSTYRSAPALHSGLGITMLTVQRSNSAAQPSPGEQTIPQSQARCFQRTFKKPVFGSYVFLIQRKRGPAPISRDISWFRGGEKGGWKKPDPFIAEKSGRGLSVVRKGRELTARYSQLHPAREESWGKRRGYENHFKLGATGETLLLHSATQRKTVSACE